MPLVPGLALRKGAPPMRTRACAASGYGLRYIAFAPRLTFGLLLAVALFVVACWDGLRADVIYLKDGYILEGNVKEESTTVFDATSGRLMTTPKLSGYFWVDDGPRKVAFSKKHFLDADKKNAARGTDPLLFDSRFRRVGGFR